MKVGNQDISVGIEIGYGLHDRGLIPGKGQDPVYSTAFRPAPASTGVYSSGVTRQVLEADHQCRC
jgi:hypothetical protein